MVYMAAADQQSGLNFETTMLACCALSQEAATLFAAHVLAPCAGNISMCSDSHIVNIWDQKIDTNCAHSKAA